MERYSWTWPSIRDPARERARRVGADYQPHFVLIDAEGGIVDAWEEGGADAEVWESMAGKLTKVPARSSRLRCG